jgi:hypothetical protein
LIQFNRYRLPDETDDFHIRFIALVNSIIHELPLDMKGSMDKLRELAHRYPLNDRLPAVAARLFFWGKVAWDDIKDILPAELPATFFYKQEIVGCLGYERAWRRYGITEDQWNLYQGMDTYLPHGHQPGGVVCYRPRSSGFFSVIENIIAADITAAIEGYQMVLDLSGNWWAYDEPFEDIFGDLFQYSNGALINTDFDAMRKIWMTPTDTTAALLSTMKAKWYNHIYQSIAAYAPEVKGIDNCGVIFVRGGDKLQTETIMSPTGLIRRDVKMMERICQQRYVLSDDKDVGERIAGLDGYLIDRSHQVEGGYHHHPGRKTSCMNILGNYLAMVEAKINFSCPSANIVNAAQWTRNDYENYSQANPVYRYLLI